MALSDPRIAEALKCGNDPVYFIKKYTKISHPLKGIIPFDCYPFQEEAIHSFQDHKHNIILKSRQLGISTVSAAYATWLAIFHPGKNVLVIATKRETAITFIDKCKVYLRTCPPFLLLKGIKQENKQQIFFENGSFIKAIGTSDDAARGESLSLLIVDECAFIKNFDKIWTSLQPTLSTGGSSIILSTPNGVGSVFHKIYTDAVAGVNNFNPIKLPWNVIPERDEAWFKEQAKSLTKQEIAQELECNFEASGDNFLAGEEMDYLQKQAHQPARKFGPGNNIWLWKEVDRSSKYVISADVSRGDGGDYSTFHIIDIYKSEVVAEYKGKIASDKFGELLVEMGTLFNNALVCPENKLYGYNTIRKLIDLKYTNLYHKTLNPNPFIQKYSEANDDIQDWGFDTNATNRFRVLAKLEIALRNKTIKIYSERFVDELKTFVFHLNKWESMKGYNDDLILSLAIGLSLYETNEKEATNDLEYTKELMKSMAISSTKLEEIKGTGTQPLWSPMKINGYQDVKNDFTRQNVKTSQRNSDLNDFSWLFK